MKKFFIAATSLLFLSTAYAGWVENLKGAADIANTIASKDERNPRSMVDMSVSTLAGEKTFSKIKLNLLFDSHVPEYKNIEYYVYIPKTKTYESNKKPYIINVTAYDKHAAGYTAAYQTSDDDQEYSFSRKSKISNREIFEIALSEKEFKRGLNDGLSITIESEDTEETIFLPAFYVEYVLRHNNVEVKTKDDNKKNSAEKTQPVVIINNTPAKAARPLFTTEKEYIASHSMVKEDTYSVRLKTQAGAACDAILDLTYKILPTKAGFPLAYYSLSEARSAQNECDGFDVSYNSSTYRLSIKAKKGTDITAYELFISNGNALTLGKNRLTVDKI